MFIRSAAPRDRRRVVPGHPFRAAFPAFAFFRRAVKLARSALASAFALGLPVCALPASAGESAGIRVRLEERTFDARSPARADFLDCPGARGACQAAAIPKAMADEKLILPRGKPLESLRFLSLIGIRPRGGDPILSLALSAAAGGDSVYADWNDDEDLGNDGPPRSWPGGDSCLVLEDSAGGASKLVLCRAEAQAQAWRARCEGLRNASIWALCDEPPFRVRFLDMRAGWLEAGGRGWRLGLTDADGDGLYRFPGADRLVIDWDADGNLEKSLEAEGVVSHDGSPVRFSLGSESYELAAADEKGAWIDVKKLEGYDPAAAAPKAAEGRPAPDLRFVNMDGDTLGLSDFRGKKVLLHFWSTLCKPCLDNLESVRSFWKGFGGKNWQVLSLTTETDLQSVQQAVIKRRMDWMVGMAGPEARRYYANRPLPVLVKIDEKGVVENRNLLLGPRSF